MFAKPYLTRVKMFDCIYSCFGLKSETLFDLENTFKYSVFDSQWSNGSMKGM